VCLFHGSRPTEASTEGMCETVVSDGGRTITDSRLIFPETLGTTLLMLNEEAPNKASHELLRPSIIVVVVIISWDLNNLGASCGDHVRSSDR
jgi:hypothetical protein